MFRGESFLIVLSSVHRAGQREARQATARLLVQEFRAVGDRVEFKGFLRVFGGKSVPPYLFSDQYIPSIPPPIPAGAAGAGSLMSATIDSVVKTVAAIDAAFWSAERVTFVGSTIPAPTMSQ